MRIYISGPISGMHDDNRASFAAAEAWLRGLGHVPCNPIDSESASLTYRENMAKGIIYVAKWTDALYMLRGWERSPGACAEHALAVALKLPIYYQHGNDKLSAGF